MKGRVVNKHARHNLCIDDMTQEPDYENKKGRVIHFNSVNVTNQLRHLWPKYFKTKMLKAEGNLYHQDGFIKMHGD